VYFGKYNIGASTNLDGTFEITIPLDTNFENDVLIASYIGYESYKLKINKDKIPLLLNIEMKTSENILGVIGCITYVKTSPKVKVKNFFRRLLRK